tara:strand:+ start:4711 stop:5007 length:297 start_codon:yes stop_codon:yes gene_type:complete
LAAAIYKCLKIKKSTLKKKFKLKLPILNVGTKQEITINNLSKLIAKFINYKGKIIFDKNSPDGTYKKSIDSSKIRDLGWYPEIDFKKGLREVIQKRKN